MIELDKKFIPQNSGTEPDENLLTSLPLPIYDAYKLLENQSDYEKSLQVLCLSLIPWTYQYIALIFSGEYLSSVYEPSFEITDSLLNMVKKPGPGKWIGFTRAAVSYFADHPTQVISPEAVTRLDEVLNSKNQPYVKISGNENKLEYSDALINIRNRFAHSRSISADKAKELFIDYFRIWKAWIVIVKEIFEARLLYRTAPGNPLQAFDNRPFDPGSLATDQDKGSTILWDSKRKKYIRLYPVIVTYSETSQKPGEVAFLEEIKSKYLFYLQGENFFKLKDEFLVLSKMIDSKTVVEEEISADNLTINTFAGRIDRITGQTITGFQDSLKYIPEMFVERPAFTRNLDNWIESGLPGCIITGDPGTGKTSIITNWCIHRKEKGDHVLLLEASSLRESDITMIIGKELNLASPLKDCLDSIQKQNRLSLTSEVKRFIIVIDAINEFTGRENENRGRLWREINSLVNILDLYKPYVKCLVTTRNDLWSFDFPGKESAYDILKDKLYWSHSENGFPRLILGDLSPDEAEEIFEKARRTIPAMAVQNSFRELTEKTKRVLYNPFLLRLALVTYSEEEMPALTRSKLEKKFARVKITEEENKKKVLFALLERMAELRKTEVTFDEFLYYQPKSKLGKLASAKDRKDLETLIFDPRYDSPYKQLLGEGILEEKSDEAGMNSKEKIKFSQEKITQIIYPEFQKRFFKRVNLAVILILLCLAGAILGEFLPVKKATAEQISKFQIELEENIQDPGTLSGISSISSGIIERVAQVTALRGSISFTIILLFMLGFTLLSVYVRFFGARIIKLDLPSRFIKEKYNLLLQKKYIYGMLPLFLLIIIFISREDPGKSFEISEKAFIIGIPGFLLYAVLWQQILSMYIVIKNAGSPNDAFILFGRKEVIQSCINNLPLLPMLLVGLGFPAFSKLNDISTDKKLQRLKQEWISDEAARSLQTENPVFFETLKERVLSYGETDPGKSYSISMFYGKIFVISIFTVYPLSLVLQYYLGFWLFKLLKRRL